MYLNNENINAKLLFILSFSLTALAIYLFKFDFFRSPGEVPHTFILNIFFINLTFLGSGIFCFCFVLFLLYKKKNSIAVLISGSTILAGIIIQIIKNYLHNNGIQIFFEDEQYLFNSVSDIGLTLFPSAHTAMAFTVATILSLYFNTIVKSALLFIVAGLIAYSRIYLGHHSIPDLFAGAFVGLASGSISFYYYLNPFKFNNIRFVTTQKFNNPEIQ